MQCRHTSNTTHARTLYSLEAQVVSGRMWCPECAAAAPPLPDHIPDTFGGADEYAAVFAPLIAEEAREGAHSAYQEARNAGRGWSAAVGRCARFGGAGRQPLYAACTGARFPVLRRLCMLGLLRLPQASRRPAAHHDGVAATNIVDGWKIRKWG